MTSTRRSVTALTAVAALALGALPAVFTSTSILAGGEDPATVESGDGASPVYQPYGWLALDTGTATTTTFTKVSNYPGTSGEAPSLAEVASESLFGIEKGPDGCLLSTDPKSLDQTQTLLTFSATAPGSAVSNAASLANGSIGAAEKKSGTSCSQVEVGETLTLGVSGELSTPAGRLVASSAFLDLELKGNATITAVASRGEETHEFLLRSGTSRTGVTTAFEFECVGASDSGPDSGVNDNCRWPISVPSWTGEDEGYEDDGIYFDTLELTATNGTFSLEGGADGLVDGAPPPAFPQTASLIELVQEYEGTLTCLGQEQTDGLPSDAAELEGDVSVTVTRLGNADGSECTPVPYSLGNALAEATFYKPLDVQLAAQFIIDLEWTIDPANTSDEETALLPESTIDYELGGGEIPLRWCPDLVPYGATEFLVVDGIEGRGDLDQDAADGIQFACLIHSDASDGGAGDSSDAVVTLSQRVYLFGDARMRL